MLLTDQTLQSIISREDPVDETLYYVWYKGWWAASDRNRNVRSSELFRNNCIYQHSIWQQFVTTLTLSFFDLCRHITLPAETIVQTNTLPPSTGSKELVKNGSGLGTQE